MPGSKSAAGATPGALVSGIETYLNQHPAAAVLEDGRVLFDMRFSHYSVNEAHGRCVFQVWSEESNVIRTVVGLEQRAQCLRVLTRKLGAPRGQALELVPTSDRRTPTTRDSARIHYQRLLERVLARTFIGSKVEAMRSAMDLEHSFGPAYARGRLLKGTSATAVIGIGEEESTSTIDGILTLGILWLDYCREHVDRRRQVGGLLVVVPVGAWRTTAERMAWLNHSAAEFQLFTLDQRSEELTAVDFRDTGNLEARLVHAFSAEAARQRMREGLNRLLRLIPDQARDRIEVCARSASEVGLALHGLEFARVRHTAAANSFTREIEVTFGAGANETPLTGENEELCRKLLARLCLSRQPDGTHTDSLYRMQPERWLEARLRTAMTEVLPGLRSDLIVSQVPALSSSDRGMLDLLTLDQSGRLVVIEVKANEDLHLPLQSLDYWIRVRMLNADREQAAGKLRAQSEFERQGYFVGSEILPAPPRMLLVAPALRIHPSNETVLRYLSPEVDWELIALGEDWRRELKVLFRKRSGK